MKRILLFKESEYIEFPVVDNLKFGNITIRVKENKEYYVLKDMEILIENNEVYHLNDSVFMLVNDNCTTYKKGQGPLLIGQKNCDMIIARGSIVIDHNKVITEGIHWIYRNGKLLKGKEEFFKYGDQILIDEILYVIHEAYIKVFAKEKNIECSLPYYRKIENQIERFPEYKRSPRIIKRLKDDKITILKPPAKVSRKKNSLVKVIVPPLVMAIGTVTMSLMMGRGIYMLIGLAGTLVSLVFSITTYYSDSKEIKERQKKRNEMYQSYLSTMRKKLYAYKQEEIEALQYNNPTIHEIYDMVQQYSPRIYERDINDDDFLTLEVGKADAHSEYNVILDYDELSTETDELLDEAKEICEEYQMVENKPFRVDLKRAHMGIVGEKHEIHEQIKWIIAQTTTFHSYHDVQIVMLYSESYKDEFDYIRWYPHVKLQSMNLTGSIYNERVKDQVLGSLHQILKDRKLKNDENKKEMQFLPHYLIIIDDYHMIMNHSIMEYLQEDTTELGFSLIYTAQKRANLPENIKTVLVMEDINTATLLLNEGIEVKKRLKEQRIGDVSLETMARDICVLQHMQGISSHIPEAVTFFDMYKAKSPQDLNIEARWAQGESHKSLAVPIGLRGEDDIEELNLHEKAHGPHGLVAGTTGSGKSETIQTYILSLAVNFSPYEVGFLLIDYKGGGMANLFKNLPHLLGTITNLDGAESMRALASIKAELSRRQRIFNDVSVNNISNYNKLFRRNEAKEPLPHLFIISDEFAELKKEQPDFMSELVSVARIGRTLGVHLILATQKPTGVVDDQIWSNSKFKLALKVQDESDSREIIKTSDAAFITQTGRGYLQVGNNEIYELFQSAWSGAIYTNEEDHEKVDTRIYKMNLLGQGELINKDLSDDDEHRKETMETQLDVVVNHICGYYNSVSHMDVKKPWLPSLDVNIESPHIKVGMNIEKITHIDLEVKIGIIDIPEEQKQEDYTIDFVKDGNLAVFSSSGYGKSTTLGTIMLSLAAKNNPLLLNMYVVDLGNSSLIPYKSLPHVADYMTFDSEEKHSKFITIINTIMKERKQLFAQALVQNYDMYNQMSEETPLKTVFIIIDNYDVVKELTVDFEDFITKITRDGAGLGIYTMISATRSNAVRFSTLNNFKNKIAQYMFDESDISGIVGRSNYKLNEDTKGRALVKAKLVCMMQVYTPVAFHNDVEFINNLKALIKNIENSYAGKQLIGIPVLPDVFTTKDFKNYSCKTINKNLIGLSLDMVQNISLEIVSSPYIILGPSKSGKTNFLQILIGQHEGKGYLFDSDNMELYKYKDQTNLHYIASEEERTVFIETLFSEVEDRKAKLSKAMDSGKYTTPKEYYTNMETFTVYIDDVDEFVERMQTFPNIGALFSQAVGVGINFIATANTAKLKGFDDMTKFFKNATSGAVLGQLGTLSIFSLSMRDIPTFGYAMLCNNGDMMKIKLPKYIGF